LYPTALAFDSSGDLYVANYSTISLVTPGGAVSTFVSSGLDHPTALAFDSSGNLYVADDYRDDVEKITIPVFGQPITFTATIAPFSFWGAGFPTGTVTFASGSTTLGSATLDATGRATFTYSGTTLPAGADTIMANYAGNGNFNPSTATIVQPVARAATATTVASSVSAPVVGQVVTLTATVPPSFGGVPTGTVTFYDGTTTLGTRTLNGGTATLTTAFATAGTHTLTATYGGNSSFLASTSAALSQTVNPDTAANLQQNLTAGGTITVQTTTPTQAHDVVSAANGLNPNTTPTSNIVVDLGGQTIQDTTASVPPQVTLTFVNGTFIGGSPALVVQSGQVIVLNSTFLNATNAPTILVTGGSLKLRNDTIEESTGYNQAAVAITGGIVDLGTATDPGNNAIVINGPGVAVQNSTGNVVPEVGDTITIIKATPVFSNLSAPVVIDGASATLAGVIRAGGQVPTGSVLITVNGVTHTAAINPDGTFSSVFATTNWSVAALAIDYGYDGDTYFNGAEAGATLDLTYGIFVVTPLTTARQAGSTIPIQIELIGASGQDLYSAGVTVTALGLAATTDTTDTTGAVNPANVGPLLAAQAAGGSDPGNVFRVQGGSQLFYMYNLQTAAGMAAGPYRLYIQVEGDPLWHWVTFTLR
jgi:hypothetical protein